MIQLLNDKMEKIGLLRGYKDLCLEKTLATGDKKITFKYPIDGKQANYIKTEHYLRTQKDLFVIKEVNEENEWLQCTCLLNVEALEGKQFPYGYMRNDITISECMAEILEETGWKLARCDIVKKRTIKIDTSCSAWNIIEECVKSFRCEIEFNSNEKIINLLNRVGKDLGGYFIEDLNLRKVDIKQDTYEFYTRMIPIGKDGIKLWFDGKNYIENYQYSNKIKTCVWRDDRYTNTTSLIEDAIAKLDELSKPKICYMADVIDLAKVNNVYKNILDFEIGDSVWLVSKKHKFREKQRIVRILEYPESPEKNVIELSNINKTFAEIQKDEQELSKVESIQITNSMINEKINDYYTKEEIETKITAAERNINLSVIQRLESFATKEELEASITIDIGQITEKVQQNINGKEIISKINLTAGEALIESRNINLKGYTKFTDLEGNGTCIINGANITAGTIMSRNYLQRDVEGNTTETGEGVLLNLETGFMKFAGKYDYAWYGQETATHKGVTEMFNGRVRVYDEKMGYLYFSSEGISTNLDGVNASGCLDFRSHLFGASAFGNEYNGVTLISNGSPCALVSRQSDVILGPHMDSRSGGPTGNKFTFTVRDNGNGLIHFGPRAYDKELKRFTYVAGWEMSGNPEDCTIYAVDKDGNPGKAKVVAANIPKAVKSAVITRSELGRITKLVCEMEDESIETIFVKYDAEGNITQIGDTVFSEV